MSKLFFFNYLITRFLDFNKSFDKVNHDIFTNGPEMCKNALEFNSFAKQ